MHSVVSRSGPPPSSPPDPSVTAPEAVDDSRRLDTSGRRSWVGIGALMIFIVVLVLLLSRTLDSARPTGLPDYGEISQIENMDSALNVEIARSTRRDELNKTRIVALMDNLDGRIVNLERRASRLAEDGLVSKAVYQVVKQWRHKHEMVLTYLSAGTDNQQVHLDLLGLGLSDSARNLIAVLDNEAQQRRLSRDYARLATGLWLAVGLLVGIWRLRSDGRALMRLNTALEEEIRLREAASWEYQQLVENANSAILRMDADMRLTYFNPYAERLFGFTSEEVIGRPVLGSILPRRDQDGRDYEALLQEVLDQPEAFDQLEIENRRHDGSALWCMWNLKRVSHDGRPELLAVGTDMTQHRRAESLVLTQNRILSEVARGESAEYLYQSVCKLVRYRVPQTLCTVHTRIQRPAVEQELIGVDIPPEFLDQLMHWEFDPGQGMTDRDLLFLEADSPELGAIAEAMEDARLGSCWIRGFGADSHRGFIAVWTEARMREPDGREREVLYSAGMIAGITAERDHLDRQLRAAKEEAEVNAATKSSFLARMSHEIRTPMSGLIGVLTLLKDREDIPREPSQHLTMAYNSAESLLALLDDILDISKIESGKLVIESVPVRLRDLVEEVAELFAQRAASKDVLLITSVDYDLPDTMYGDPTRIRQVISNLLGNAVKFTDSGEIEVRVELQERGDSSARVRFLVRDTGIGIPDEARSKIFESFVQAKSSTTRKYGGTGLGLPLSRDLVTRMGGELDVSSVPGQGSVFEFTLDMPEDVDADTPADQPYRGRFALVIDPSASRTAAIIGHLRALGFDHQAFSSRTEAFEQIGKADCDLVVDCAVDGDTGEASLRGRCRELGIGLVRIDSKPFASQESADGFAHVSSPVKARGFRDAIEVLLDGGTTNGAALVQSPSARPKPKAAAELMSGQVLLVEDQEVNRLVARGLLEKLGYRPHEVENGALAVKAVSEADYQLVLMDCEMPILDGYGATEQIRELERQSGRHVPIVAVTAHALPEHRDRCLRIGMDDYLAKPYKLNDLKAIIEKWLVTAPAAADSPGQLNGTEPDSKQEPAEAPVASVGEVSEVSGAIDREEFQDILDTFGEDIVQLIDSFTDVLPRKLNAMREAIDSGDSESLRSEAHSLKGIANTVAARPSGVLCKTLEEAGRSGELDGADETLRELEAESARALIALREAVNG